MKNLKNRKIIFKQTHSITIIDGSFSTEYEEFLFKGSFDSDGKLSGKASFKNKLIESYKELSPWESGIRDYSVNRELLSGYMTWSAFPLKEY